MGMIRSIGICENPVSYTHLFAEKEFPDVRRFRLEVTRCNERAISLYRRLGYEELDYIQMIKDR